MLHIDLHGAKKQQITSDEGFLTCPVCDWSRMQRGEVILRPDGQVIKIRFDCEECETSAQLTIDSSKGKTSLRYGRARP